MENYEKYIDEIWPLLEKNPWFKEVLSEMRRRANAQQVRKQLSDKVIQDITEAYLEYELITSDKLEAVQNEEIFIHAKDILEQIKPGEPFPNQLTELFVKQKPDAVIRIHDCAKNLIAMILDENIRAACQRLWETDRQVLEELDINRLPNEIRTLDPQVRYIIKSLIDLHFIQTTLESTNSFIHNQWYYANAARKGDTASKANESVSHK